jgi:hypothetical protein
MAAEVTVVLRFEHREDMWGFKEDVESEFDCDIIEWEEEEV